MHIVQDLRDRLPFAFIGAGLPHLPSYIARTATYAERFRYESTDNLHHLEARAAVLEPAAAEDVSWDDDALAMVVAVAAGYPYFLSDARLDRRPVSAFGDSAGSRIPGEMSSEPVVRTRLPSLELPVEELLRRARPLPSLEEMLLDDLDEVEGLAFLAALNG
ncbi:MAG: hypothetical protein ABSE47_02980 [Acidimicrobiales bacterium]